MSPRRFALVAATTAALTAITAQAATVQVRVTARDGQPLPDAVVVIEPTTTTTAPIRAPAPVQTTITQQKMQFSPAVSVLPVGSRVRFVNLDGWEHHVRGLPSGLAGLNAGPKAGFELRLDGRTEGREPQGTDVTLDKAGPLALGCHIHGSMRGFIYVADTPWALKTDAAGMATLRDVPEGPARVRVWHADQLVDAPPLAVTIQAVSAIEVPTPVQPRRRRP